MKTRQPASEKRCRVCKNEKPLAEFPYRPTLEDKSSRVCSICTAANKKHWKHLLAERAVRRTRRKKLKEKDAIYEACKEWLTLREFYRRVRRVTINEKIVSKVSMVCPLCGVYRSKTMTETYFYPVPRPGGNSSAWFIVVCCWKCYRVMCSIAAHNREDPFIDEEQEEYV